MLDLANLDSARLHILQRKYMFLLGPIESYKSGEITVCNNVNAHSSFLLFEECFVSPKAL